MSETVARNGSLSEVERYTLDTSAVIAFFTDEPGAGEVERLLADAVSGRARVFVSFMTFMEVLYRISSSVGQREGRAAYLRLKGLPVERIDAPEPLLLSAARIKSGYNLSLADAWIAATALFTGSRLVHKDPEFRQLEGHISVLELPLKPRRRVT